MRIRTLSLSLFAAVALAACSPAPVVPPVQPPPAKPPLEKPASPTMGTPKTGVPGGADVGVMLPIPGAPASPGPGPAPTPNELNKAFARMAATTVSTFDSFSKSPEWLDLGRFVGNCSPTPTAMPISPKAVLELARAQAKAGRSGQSLTGQSSAAQTLSSEARTLLSRISALAASSGPNPLPTGTYRPKVGSKAGCSDFEKVSDTPTDGVKFIAKDGGNEFILETNWKVGGKPTQAVSLELGALIVAQELPTAFKTTLSENAKTILELSANLDYGTCLSKLGPVSLDLSLKAPSGLDVAVKYSRSSAEISGSVMVNLTSGGQTVALDSSGKLSGSLEQSGGCGLKITPSSYSTSSSFAAGADKFESKLDVVNLKGITAESGVPTVYDASKVGGFVSGSAQLGSIVLLSAYGSLEDTNKNGTVGDALEVKFSNGESLYTTTLEALIKSGSQVPVVPPAPTKP